MSWLAGHGNLDEENDNLGIDWVLQYEFGDIGTPASHPGHTGHTTHTHADDRQTRRRP